MAFDVLIRGGMVIDGSGRDGVQCDVGIRGARIEAVAPNLPAVAERVIDASALVVAPGFIDIHAHGDLYPLMCPEAPARLHDGVTTEVLGNCGESPFPQSEAMLAARADSEKRYGVAVDWRTLDDFARRHDELPCGINRASLVGQGTVREAVMGEVNRPPTPEELDAMRREVAEALDAGAFGLSTGLIYSPGIFTPPEEIHALCEVAAERGALYASHIRNEGDTVDEAIEELADVGRRTGVRLQLSHVKVAGVANWGKAGRVIERLHALRGSGLDLACDRYPYRASSTGLSALLPGWAREGGRSRMLERIAGPEVRRRAVVELDKSAEEWAPWRDVLIADASCDAWRHADGRSVEDIATEAGREAAETVLDLLTASEGKTSIVVFSMCEENLVSFLGLPFVAIGSDSSSRSAEGPTAVGKPHPRSYGTSARVLGRYVREKRLLSLPDAVRRLTGLPASRLGLRARGLLREGAFADVTVFDPERIADRATFEHPQQYSAGVCFVLVNGALAVADGELTGARNGRFLRRGSE